jgi:sulfite exporter TauE/SafE/copper chaperone CopZ
MKKKSNIQKTTLYIKGMHCPSCDILVKDKFGECANVKSVKANHKTQTAEISYKGELDTEELNSKIQKYGYSIADEEATYEEPLIKRITDAAAIGIILFIVYYFAQQLDLLPNVGVSPQLNYLTAFILGVVASTSTCMATSGALFLATVGKLNSKGLSFKENIVPAVSFNIGRIISYGVFGFIVGFLGKALFVNFNLGPLLTLFVSIVMILIGLDMLRLISFSWVSSTSFTKSLFERLEHRFLKNPKQTAFLLGAITYLLPCGFTQSVQMYALGLADPVKSATLMMTFALGTVPALLAIGFLSSFTRSVYYPLFAKVMGIVIVFIGVGYLLTFASLRGVDIAKFMNQTSQKTVAFTQPIEQKDGYQIIRMSVDNKGYSPREFTVKEGQEVKWIVNGKTNFGCQTVLTAPQLGVSKYIQLGDNVITFTPKQSGDINFSCEMGMYQGVIHVINS